MVQSVKLIYTRIILFLRWAIYILLLFGLFHSKHITGTKIINFDSTVLIVFIGIYYIGVTFLTFYYDKDIKNYIVIFIDFLVGALVFLTYPITVNSLPPVHITMLFALPIFETGLLSKKKCLTATILSILVFCGLMEYAKIKYAKELPNFVLTSDFVYVVVFFLVIYLFGYLYFVLNKLKNQSDTLISIIEAGQELGTTTDVTKLVFLVDNMLNALFSPESTVVYIAEEREGSAFMKMILCNLSDGRKLFDFDPKISKSILAKVYKEKAACIIEDFTLLPKDDILSEPKTFCSMMIVPLIKETKVLGLILTAHQHPKYYKQDNFKLLSMLSNQVALSIHNIQLNEATKTLAITDSLSGLFTHGYFQEHLNQQIVKHKYEKKPVSLLILDVDFFKKINDSYGHPQGDSLLKQLGGVIKTVIRPEDVVCRYGGDEFTITMLNTSRIEAAIIAERIRQAVEEYEFVLGAQLVHITVSGGVSSFPEDSLSKKEIVEKADKALYEAKQKGRNKICFCAT